MTATHTNLSDVAIEVIAQRGDSQVIAHFVAFIANIVGVALSELSVVVVSPTFDPSVIRQTAGKLITDGNLLESHIGSQIHVIPIIHSEIIGVFISELTITEKLQKKQKKN